MYDPSGDSTIPSTSKKRKFEEVAEGAEPETPTAKIKKPKKEPVIGVCYGERKTSIFCVQFVMLNILCIFWRRGSSCTSSGDSKEEEEKGKENSWSWGTRRRAGRNRSNLLLTVHPFKKKTFWGAHLSFLCSRQKRRKRRRKRSRTKKMMNEKVYIFYFSLYVILVMYHSGSEVIGSAITAKYVVSLPYISPVLQQFHVNFYFLFMYAKSISAMIC